jgi:hypothetical protein
MAPPVTACKVHRDVVVLIVDMPDSTLAMTRSEEETMKQRRAFDQLIFLQLNQPSFVLRGTRRARTIGPKNAAGDFVQRSRAHLKQGER